MPLEKHAWTSRYVCAQLVVSLIRAIVLAAQWLRIMRVQPLPAGALSRRITVPSRNVGRLIKVDIYEPVSYDKKVATPVLINLHGSGFCLPALGSDRAYCAFIASHTARPMTVFDIDYRKAPEHPFPAALQDAEDIVFHVASQPARFDVNNIFLSGFSAGGCIALSTAAMLGPKRIKGVAAFSAPVDLSKIYDAPEKTIVTGSVIPPVMHNLFFDAYLLPSQARNNSRVSPVFAPAESFPRHVYLACGNADNLYTPAKILIQKLKEAGHGDAVFVTAERVAHFFEQLAKDGSETAAKRDRMYADVVDMINRAAGEIIERL